MAGSGTVCQIHWKLSAASINGTYCLHPGGIAPMYVSPACVYYAYISTGVSGLYYPDASTSSQCAGRTYTVTGFSIYAEIASGFNNLAGATPVGVLSVCAALKSDGTNVQTAADFQTAPYVWSVADLGLYGFWDGSCGGTITWSNLSNTCASAPASYALNYGGSAVGTDIAC